MKEKNFINLNKTKKSIRRKIKILLKEKDDYVKLGKIYNAQFVCNQIVGLNLSLYLINKIEKVKIYV